MIPRKILVLSLLVVLFTVACNNSNQKKTSNTDIKPLSQVDKAALPPIDMDEYFYMALQGNLEFLEKAHASGVNVNATNNDNQTALMLASFNGHLLVVQYLIHQGANVNLKDKTDRSAIMFASTGPYNAVVKELIKYGAKVNEVDNIEHWTALMFASGEGQLDVVKTLIENGADASMQDIDGESSMDFAKTNGHQHVVNYLESLN